MATTTLTDATGARVTAIQDNGGITTQSPGFESAANTATRNAKLTLFLYSYESSVDAAQGFQQLSPRATPAPVALPGVGDKALADNSRVVVQKGSQVLQIDIRASDALEQPLARAKEQGTTLSQSALDAYNLAPARDATALAKSIALNMTGASARGSLRYLPKGALDPCGVDVSKLTRGGITVTSTPAISENNGTSDCIYTFTGSQRGQPGTGSLRVSTMTVAQGAAAIPPTSPATWFKKIPSAYGGGPSSRGHQFDTASSGALSILGQTSGELNAALLATPPSARASTVLIHIRSERSLYVVDAERCKYDIVELFHNELSIYLDVAILGIPQLTAAGLNDLAAIGDWCRALAAANPNG